MLAGKAITGRVDKRWLKEIWETSKNEIIKLQLTRKKTFQQNLNQVSFYPPKNQIPVQIEYIDIFFNNI